MWFVSWRQFLVARPQFFGDRGTTGNNYAIPFGLICCHRYLGQSINLHVNTLYENIFAGSYISRSYSIRQI